MRINFLYLLLIILLSACHNAEKKTSEIRISIEAPATGKIYLTKIGFNEEKDKIVDSSINGLFYNYSFKVPNDLSAFYQVKVPFFSNSVYIIPDADIVNVSINLSNNKFTVNGSPASSVLYGFYTTLKAKNANELPSDVSITPGINNITTSYTLPFMDTVSSPAIFMIAYNTVEFGKDYTTLKKVLDKAAKRFPTVSYILQLKVDADRMIDVYEKEFNINDQLPSINLIDTDSLQYSTASLKGKYYLINFWSTWCEQCFPYLESMKQQYGTVDTTKIAFVSAAVDDNRIDWKHIVQQNKYSWKNLIDVKMWKGDAVNTLKFDSIPFNFLVSPEGKVLAKAITPDSLQYYLEKHNLLKR